MSILLPAKFPAVNSISFSTFKLPTTHLQTSSYPLPLSPKLLQRPAMTAANPLLWTSISSRPSHRRPASCYCRRSRWSSFSFHVTAAAYVSSSSNYRQHHLASKSRTSTHIWSVLTTDGHQGAPQPLSPLLRPAALPASLHHQSDFRSGLIKHRTPPNHLLLLSPKPTSLTPLTKPPPAMAAKANVNPFLLLNNDEHPQGPKAKYLNFKVLKFQLCFGRSSTNS